MNKQIESRIPELDGFRAIAIVAVLISHVFWGFQIPQDLYDKYPRVIVKTLDHGWLGVDLFFMLSGFLITGILLETRARPDYFQRFYTRRALRIMPLYFSVVMVWFLFYPQNKSYFALSSVFGANLSWLLGIPEPHGPAVLWSLAVEEHFYLIWPLLVLVLSRRMLAVSCGLIFTLTPVLRGIYASGGMNPELIYMLSWFRFDGLAAGALLAIWAHSTSDERRQALRIGGILLFAFGFLTLTGNRFGLSGTKTPVAVALRYTQAYLLFGSGFIVVYAFRGARWLWPLRSAPLQLIGALSYCMYLVHLWLGDVWNSIFTALGIRVEDTLGTMGNILARGCFMLVASIAIALFTRKWIEKPFLRMKDRLRAPAMSVAGGR